jgi:uncharacterized protein (DUF58 family)
VLTRRGKVAISAFFFLVVAGRILGVTELWGIATAIGVLVLVSFVRVRVSRVRASITSRLSPEVIEAGQPTVLELFVENTGLGPTPGGRLQLLPSGGGRHRIVVPRLAPSERATVTIGLDSTRRGRHGITGYDVILVDGLGLAAERVTSTGSIGYLVRPRTEELPRTLPLSAGGGRESTQSSAERLLTGFSNLRGYVEGDDLRRVHWRTTARVGELMVREGGDPDSANRSGTTIVLGTKRGASDAFERAVEVASSLVVAAAHEGRVRLITTDGYDSDAATGAAHLDAIGLELATIQPTAPSAPRRRGGGDGGAGRAATGAASVAGQAIDPTIARLAGRRSSPDDWNVLVTVEAVTHLGEAELSPTVLAELPFHFRNVVLVLVGGDLPRFERLARNEIVVYLPPARAMHDIWNTALDLPIGESRSIDVTLAEFEGAKAV